MLVARSETGVSKFTVNRTLKGFNVLIEKMILLIKNDW